MCALGRYRHSLCSLAWLDFSYLPTHTARKVGRRLLIIANNNNNHEFGLNEMCVVAPNSAHTLKAVDGQGRRMPIASAGRWGVLSHSSTPYPLFDILLNNYYCIGLHQIRHKQLLKYSPYTLLHVRLADPLYGWLKLLMFSGTRVPP